MIKEHMMDVKRIDAEFTKKIDRIVYGEGEIKQSKERQNAAERLIQQRDNFRKRHGLIKKNP